MFITQEGTRTICFINWYNYIIGSFAVAYSLIVLQSFREDAGRDPCVSSLKEDQMLLEEIKLKVLNNEKLAADLVTDMFIRLVIKEVTSFNSTCDQLCGQGVLLPGCLVARVPCC